MYSREPEFFAISYPRELYRGRIGIPPRQSRSGQRRALSFPLLNPLKRMMTISSLT
jgi:hypothetical protein